MTEALVALVKPGVDGSHLRIGLIFGFKSATHGRLGFRDGCMHAGYGGYLSKIDAGTDIDA